MLTPTSERPEIGLGIQIVRSMDGQTNSQMRQRHDDNASITNNKLNRGVSTGSCKSTVSTKERIERLKEKYS